MIFFLTLSKSAIVNHVEEKRGEKGGGRGEEREGRKTVNLSVNIIFLKIINQNIKLYTL